MYMGQIAQYLFRVFIVFFTNVPYFLHTFCQVVALLYNILYGLFKCIVVSIWQGVGDGRPRRRRHLVAAGAP